MFGSLSQLILLDWTFEKKVSGCMSWVILTSSGNRILVILVLESPTLTVKQVWYESFHICLLDNDNILFWKNNHIISKTYIQAHQKQPNSIIFPVLPTSSDWKSSVAGTWCFGPSCAAGDSYGKRQGRDSCCGPMLGVLAHSKSSAWNIGGSQHLSYSILFGMIAFFLLIWMA